MGKQGRLRKPRKIQLLFRVAKRKLRNVVTQNVTCLGIDFSGDFIFVVEVATDSPILRTLPGEDEKNILFGLTHGDGTGGIGESEE